ncbi:MULTISPECIES: hypothetical protein [unclassified Synechocystis]|uniref:hypothetical protein n=1 Tax=unclassified Synechocystis TaxID=2640012 RepID=UPI000407FB75|nr:MULTISPECIES: hypothetical protein [unclassified Synechocystis]AIE73263.1 hypothetical protein D082_07340 [Synechocystis sp. PCC 6714]MCT0253090.1 hypothetical protein [Synechocystis sp. CS-94]
MIHINWQALAAISELQPYFAEDFAGFQQQIEQRLPGLMAISGEELDNLAVLRVLEICNGCLQWAFRRQDEHCLSVEQTRECMQTVIGFIKLKKITCPSGKIIGFTPAIEQLIEEGTQLYRQAFKQNNQVAKQEYYAYSTAQFIAYGGDRLEWAQDLVEREFSPLLTPHFILRGRKYIAPYLQAIVTKSV